MRVIKANSIAQAHEKAISAVFMYHDTITTEDGEISFESEPLTLVIPKNNPNNRISKFSPFRKAFLDEYTKCVLHGSVNEFVYDYHQRLFGYEGLNQIQTMIDKIKAAPTTRRAVAITWQPAIDNFVKDVPCLQLITGRLRTRDGVRYFDMEVVFRSNDVLMAMGSNMYALVALQEYIAEALGVSAGRYTHVMLCPHIYFVRDETNLVKFLEGIDGTAVSRR
jgi:thymidylate synthase